MEVNEHQVAGTHYKSTYQHWDFVLHLNLPYLPSQVTKYVSRYRKKNGLQDLQKAKHFLEKYIEAEKFRINEHRMLAFKYFKENNIEGLEKNVTESIIQYNTGSLNFLTQALDSIEKLIYNTAQSTENVSSM